LKGKSIQLKNGYPDVGPNGTRRVVPDVAAFTVSSTPTSVTYSKTGAPAGARCAVTYHVSPAAAGEAAITDLSTGGC
jgi:hypothetical protein